MFRIDVGLFFPGVGLLYYKIFFFFGFFFLLESITNYEAKFNFIGIKKTKGVPKFFLKGRQIKYFKFLYINFFFQVRVILGPPWP